MSKPTSEQERRLNLIRQIHRRKMFEGEDTKEPSERKSAFFQPCFECEEETPFSGGVTYTYCKKCRKKLYYKGLAFLKGEPVQLGRGMHTMTKIYLAYDSGLPEGRIIHTSRKIPEKEFIHFILFAKKEISLISAYILRQMEDNQYQRRLAADKNFPRQYKEEIW